MPTGEWGSTYTDTVNIHIACITTLSLCCSEQALPDGVAACWVDHESLPHTGGLAVDSGVMCWVTPRLGVIPVVCGVGWALGGPAGCCPGAAL